MVPRLCCRTRRGKAGIMRKTELSAESDRPRSLCRVLFFFFFSLFFSSSFFLLALFLFLSENSHSRFLLLSPGVVKHTTARVHISGSPPQQQVGRSREAEKRREGREKKTKRKRNGRNERRRERRRKKKKRKRKRDHKKKNEAGVSIYKDDTPACYPDHSKVRYKQEHLF
jgi:hypothetical protein